LIVEHSIGKYFGFNLRESNKPTSAISIVHDKDEFMVMGWKVAKVIPTWVLGFVDWNNLNVEASITNMIMNPNKEWLACKKTHHLT
jgi:hypothetical protein